MRNLRGLLSFQDCEPCQGGELSEGKTGEVGKRSAEETA